MGVEVASNPLPRAAADALSIPRPPLTGRKGKIRLDLNENTAGPSPRVLEALSLLSPYDIASYPDNTDAYARLARQFHLSESQILITNGGEEAIRLVLDAFAGPDAEVVLPVPTFQMFRFYLDLCGIKVHEVPARDGFAFPVSDITSALSPAVKVVFLSTPNHTTGRAIPLDEIRQVLEVAGKHGSIVLVDEAYYDFHGQTSLPWLDEFPHLVVVRTFSKAYGLGGLRAGLMFGHADTMKVLGKVQSPYTVNRAAVVALGAALSDQVYINRHVQSVHAQRRALESLLRDTLKLSVVPSDANFLVVDFGDRRQEVFEGLQAEGILVRDISTRPRLEGCLRIGMGSASEMAALAAALRALYGQPSEQEAAEPALELQSSERTSRALRKFPDGELALTLALDGTGSARVVAPSESLTGALQALASGARFDVELEVQGEVPTKHLGLIFGQALGEALGNARVIGAGSFAFPVGDALAVAAIDLNGRPHLSCQLEADESDPLLTFLTGLSTGAKATVAGHMIRAAAADENRDALFTALGHALRQAKQPALTS